MARPDTPRSAPGTPDAAVATPGAALTPDAALIPDAALTPDAALIPDAALTPLFVAAAEVQRVCREADWRCCLVGALAVHRWGRPRPTEDVDLLVLTGYGAEATVADGLFARFTPRAADSRQLALAQRLVQLRATNGVSVDVALGTSRRLHRALRRASWWEVAGVRLLTCGAEDLIVNKALSDRERDWADMAGIVARQGDRLDRDLVWSEFGPVREQGHQLGDPLAQLRLAQLRPEDGQDAVARMGRLLGVAR